MSEEIPYLKEDADFIWLKEVNSQSLQSTARNLDIAFKRFFTGKCDFPRYKSKKDTSSFEIPQNTTVDFENHKVFIPKFKEGINVVFHREFVGKICLSTIKKKPSGKYFISILVDDGKELPVKPEPDENNAVGIDVGIKTYLVASDGKPIPNPRILITNIKRLRKLSRAFSRKLKKHKKGDPLSKNAEKAKLELQLLHERVANQRNDFLHQTSSQLIRDNQTICIEDLNVKGMIQNHNLAKHIKDLALGKFFNMLTYKADWYGKNILTIGRFVPSSKTCSKCGWIFSGLTLKHRSWTCQECDTEHDRDVNAAVNIKQFAFLALRQLVGQVRNTHEVKPASYGNRPWVQCRKSAREELEADETLDQR
jgi:putative transposase